ncbi:hypothetical protein ACFQRK_04420 [Parapedobacter sp. GCM10030251]|uniref:hypothetical protein n=1 Tax=Parapedobacter sp. GCM10030251 TaxID=3273419 RepID=UPI003619B9CB
MKKSRIMIGISLGLFALALMLFRLAYAAVVYRFSVWLMIGGVVLMLTAIVVFIIYFRER